MDLLFSEDIKEIKVGKYVYYKPKEKKKNKFQLWIDNNPREYSNMLLNRIRFYNDTEFYKWISEKSLISVSSIRKHFLRNRIVN